MPIFDFKCENCGIIKKDVYIKPTKKKRVLCPKCKKPMKKLIGNFRPIFHGEGFYENDYKNKKRKKR